MTLTDTVAIVVMYIFSHYPAELLIEDDLWWGMWAPSTTEESP